jgi:ubiquinone/menaquinone biosynthesis C-methylase UbiE
VYNRRLRGHVTDTTTAAPKSLVLHSGPRHYDLLASLLTLGREGALRQRLVDLARIAPGETVLDVGCGTGSLALAAKRRVGPAGRVAAIDASPEMIAQARAKSAKLSLDVEWNAARAESLPCPAGSVDVVLSTLMMHHLPRVVREAFAGEIRRVLKPDGRVLVVDFEPPPRGGGGLISRVHRHGHVPRREIVELLTRSQLRVVDAGSVGASDLHFALATPAAANASVDPSAVQYRQLPSLPIPRWLLATTAISAVLVLHAVVFFAAWRTLAWGTAAVLAIAGIVVAHGGVGALFHARLRRRSGGRRP